MLTDKTILILSPQDWGKMLISKHHYAIELSKFGNKVLFLNPPKRKKLSSIQVRAVEGYQNLYVIDHSLLFPYRVKLYSKQLFHFFMKWQIKRILLAIGSKVDIVWSFDIEGDYPFTSFASSVLKIFHPVDEPPIKADIRSIKNFDVLFGVTKEILEKFRKDNVPALLIEHGVNEIFFKGKEYVKQQGEPIRVGLSGNFLRPDIDWSILIHIIQSNPSIIFECWGAYRSNHGNIGAIDNCDTQREISTLRKLPNAIMHGPVPPEELSRQFPRMDLFLICYNIQKDQSKGTNYHKIMEYLSTGKTIVSNNVSAYKDTTDLIVMTENRRDNTELPILFHQVVNDLNRYNSDSRQILRKDYARQNSYTNQLKKIEEKLVGEGLL